MTARQRAFGLDVVAAFDLPELPAREAGHVEPDVTLRLADAEELDAAWSGPDEPPRVRETVIDSEAYRAERGAAGDLLIEWGACRFHLSPDDSVVLCVVPDPSDAGWRRLLLDTVLATVSMRQGFELIHAGAVVLEAGLLAVIAGTGGGKSTLVAELVGRGATLFCDDLLTLVTRGEKVLCEPGPALMNLALDGPGTHTRLGRELARFDDEAWIAVERPTLDPMPLAGFIVLDRDPEAHAPKLAPLRSAHLVLMGAALDTGRDAARRKVRFRVVSDLASTTQGLALRAPIDTPPAELAALAETAIDSSRARVGR